MNAEKATIAQKIVDTIRNKGGRFLKRDESDGAVDDVVFNGVQCLRRQSKKRHHGDKADDVITAETNPLLSEVAASSLQVPGLSSAPRLLPVAPPTLLMCFLPASPAGVLLAHQASLLLLATDPGDAQVMMMHPHQQHASEKLSLPRALPAGRQGIATDPGHAQVMMRPQQHASEKLTPSTLPAFQQGTGAALWPPQQRQEVQKTPVSRPTATKKLQDQRASMRVQPSPQPNTCAATEATTSTVSENEEDEEGIRSIWHATEEHEIEYGITREMTPAELGGLIRLDASEWVAHRRAVEMKEI